MLKDIPNWLTISRVLIIPVILVAMYFDDSVFGHRVAAFLFLCACLTDFLDGYLARVWKVQSLIGSFLDPIADKLLVGSVIVMLVHYKLADLFPAIAIICREILVSGLREFLADIKVKVPVTKIAKYKTFIQMAAMFLLILGDVGSGLSFVNFVGGVVLWIAAIFTVITGYAYFRASYHHLINNNNG